ncbi:MAG: porin [Gallionellaceae bacterium]|nr:porin [Gallionellaceae bacterium]
MQKRLIIAALVAAINLPMPVLADTANVTIYGTADASFDMTNNGDNPRTGATGARVNRISSSSSKIGFKGEEDLGDGLKAIWQVETEVDLDGSNTAGAAPTNSFLGTRNTFVGLKNDSLGSLIFGRHDTPYKTSDRRLDLFYDHVTDNRALMAGGKGKGSADPNGFAKRVTDIVMYNSPVMNGFKVTAAYVAGAESATLSTQSKGSIWSLAGTYDIAPFFGSLAYQRNEYGTVGTGVVAAANGASPNTRETAWKLGGGYKVSQFAINAAYERISDNFGGGAATAGTACAGLAAGASCYGHKAIYLSGQYNLTANDAVKLAYTKAYNLQDGNAVNTGAKHVTVGYDHTMSKRTNLYVTYTKLNNDANMDYSLNGENAATANVTALAKGASPSAFSLGMKHIF